MTTRVYYWYIHRKLKLFLYYYLYTFIFLQNEPTYIPPENLPRSPGITAATNAGPNYIARSDSLVDYGYHVYETLPSVSEGPVAINRPSSSSRVVAENLSPGYDQLASPPGFVPISAPNSGYNKLTLESHGADLNTTHQVSEGPAAGIMRSDYEIPVPHDPAPDSRPPRYDHLTGPQTFHHNTDSDSYNHLNGRLSPRSATPNQYSAIFPEYLELEDHGALQPSAPTDSLDSHYRERHMPTPSTHTYYVLSKRN